MNVHSEVRIPERPKARRPKKEEESTRHSEPLEEDVETLDAGAGEGHVAHHEADDDTDSEASIETTVRSVEREL